MLRCSLRRLTAGALITLTVSNSTACFTWRPVEHATPQQIKPEPKRLYRVEMLPGGSQLLEGVNIRSDSLFGRLSMAHRPDTNVAIPLRDVRSLDRREFNKPLTAVTFAVAAVLAIGAHSLIQSGVDKIHWDQCYSFLGC